VPSADAARSKDDPVPVDLPSDIMDGRSTNEADGAAFRVSRRDAATSIDQAPCAAYIPIIE
jgi:hypothetical protein